MSFPETRVERDSLRAIGGPLGTLPFFDLPIEYGDVTNVIFSVNQQILLGAVQRYEATQ